MFKWPGSPSPRASDHELADFAELVCWKEDLMSVTALSKHLGRLEENNYYDGVPEDEEKDGFVEAAYLEIERRGEVCRKDYPFVVDDKGYVLRTRYDAKNHKHIIYKYLLLATRLNMKSNRVHADMDGTLLFEELAAEAAREYVGARAEAVVFGTGAQTADFPRKINELCNLINEGGRFENRGETARNVKDGKLDVVVWKHFADQLPGKLIAFGQCKTGTNYRDTLGSLQPDSFCKNWMYSPPPLTPMRMFFVAEALSRLGWYSVVSQAGVLFDRCRMIDFCDNIRQPVLERIRSWTMAAAAATALPV